MEKLKVRVPVRVGSPADEDTKRIRRKKRKRQTTPRKEERRRERSLKKHHPIADEQVVEKEVEVDVDVPSPEPIPLTPEQIAHRHELVHGPCGRFLRDSDRLENAPRSKGWKQFLRLQHRDIFHQEAPDVGPRKIEVKCAYELLRRGYVAAGEKIPEKIFRQMEASRTMSLEGFHDNMRGLLESDPQWTLESDPQTQSVSEEETQGEKVMATKEKRKEKKGPRGSRGYTGKTSGLKAHEYWVQLFEQNHKKKATDEQLGSIMAKEFPNAKRDFNLAIVRQHRTIYNGGKFVSQDKPPARPSVPYAADGTELPLRYRVTEKGSVPKTAVAEKQAPPAPKKDRGKKASSKRIKLRRQKVAQESD